MPEQGGLQMIGFARPAAIFTCVAALAAVDHANAQSGEDFYRGKSIYVVVGSGPGSGYDVYARSLVRYWAQHIPGDPTFVVQNMPGAGGVTMLNYVADVAKPDGTILGAGFANTVIEPVFDKGKVTKYDSRKLNWISSISPQTMGCFTWGTSKVKTIEQAQTTPVIMAMTSNSISATSANIVNATLGTKFKIVMGYTSSEGRLAIERGEAEGTCLSSATIISEHPDWMKEHKLNWLITISDKPDPLLPGTPIAADYVKTDEDKKVLSLIVSQLSMGRPYALPAGVPADRVEILRKSFMETMKDPAYLAEAKRLNMYVDPSDHTEMERMIDYTYSIPDDIVGKAEKLIDGVPSDAVSSK
jgi:tripartite-type tricarboxylate transporter receptor subunit TctC